VIFNWLRNLFLRKQPDAPEQFARPEEREDTTEPEVVAPEDVRDEPEVIEEPEAPPQDVPQDEVVETVAPEESPVVIEPIPDDVPEEILPPAETLEQLPASDSAVGWPEPYIQQPEQRPWPVEIEVSGSGIEASSSPGEIAVGGPPEPDESLLMPEDGFWAKITGNADADDPVQNRWHYSWEEVHKTTAGYDGWATVSDGRSGTTTVDQAYNLVEDMNTAADDSSPTMQGNGVDVDGEDFPEGFEVQPCATGVFVKIYEVSVSDTVEYWFSYENGIDGTCAAEEE